MCEYCDNSFIDCQKSSNEYLTHKPFRLEDDAGNRIKAVNENIIMYLREYIKPHTHLWNIICDQDGKIIFHMSIIYCPICGNKLVKNRR